MLFVIAIKRSVICNRDTWRRKELSCDRITVENTHDKYCDTLSNLAPIILQLISLNGNSYYIILVDVTQVVICFNDWSVVDVGQEG
jgi:hypothetical protein